VGHVFGPVEGVVDEGKTLKRRRTHTRTLYISVDIVAESEEAAEALILAAMVALPKSIDDGSGNSVIVTRVMPEWISDASRMRRRNSGAIAGFMFQGGIYADEIFDQWTETRPVLGESL
jgi:hypothetical protein